MPEKPKKAAPAWQNDPWYVRSEEFYGMVYHGGKCRYCGMAINTPLDHCDCAEMQAARSRF